MKERSTGKLWLPLMAACLLMMGIFSLSVSTKAADNDSSAPEIPGLTFQSEMQNEFAECFHIYYYNDDYTLIDVPDSGQFLLVPEGKSAPDGLDKDIVVLQKPLDNIYLAATSAMSLFSSLDALDDIKFSSSRHLDGMLMRQNRQWKTATSFLPANTVSRIMNFS